MTSYDHEAVGSPGSITDDLVEREGFTLLASGGPKPLFDIVFVHGLQGHPELTWTHIEYVQQADQSDSNNKDIQRTFLSKALHLFRQDEKATQQQSRTFWPRDMLPEHFPSARILTYGYASRVSYFFGNDRPSHENLTENGRTFLNGLAAHRSHAVGRPLMLITHSLGGLIIKSEAFYITSFQETRSFRSIKGLDSKIVENDSSGLDHKHERKQGINANHIEMCKFAKTGRSHIEYRDKVRREIQRHSERMSKESKTQQENCMKALKDCAVTNIREEQVEPAHGQTLYWLLRAGTGPDSPRLFEWLSNQWGVFWIQGRPGSGKSTAMKFLLHHPQTVKSLNLKTGPLKWRLAGVFFTDRLSEVERSWKGLLASLLDQLVTQVTELQELIVPFSLRKRGKTPETSTFEQSPHEWSILSLQQALLFCKNQQIVEFKMCYFVDALDENDESKHSRRNVSNFLMQLASDPSDAGYGIFKICTASRPENDLSELLSSYNGFKMQEWTRPDIEAYVGDKLGEHPPMRALVQSQHITISERARTLMASIVHKAEGVFLWVRLIVEDLRDSLTNGLALGIDDLEERLGQTPQELRELYVLILRRIPPDSTLDAYVIFECVLRARQPISLLDLWLILETRKKSCSQDLHGVSDDQVSSILRSKSALERRIKTCSGGLLEVRIQSISLNRYTVQVLHQTVREYLIESSILTFLLYHVKGKPVSAQDKADFIFLRTHLYWLRTPKTRREELCFGAPVYGDDNLLWHASGADQLKFEPYIGILDQIDRIMCSENNASWPALYFMSIEDPEITNLNLFTHAISVGMYYYVEQKLQENPGLISRLVGKPLLHFAVDLAYSDSWLKSDENGALNIVMLKLLLRHGANVADRYDYGYGEVTSLQVLSSISMMISGSWNEAHLEEALSVLMEYDADPNQTITVGEEPSSFVPLIFALLVRPGATKRKVSMIKCLVEHGADLEALDYRHWTFVDRALLADFLATTADWIWLFERGLRIHSAAVSRLYGPDAAHHSLRAEICRKPTYYSPGARRKAAKFNPQWTFTEKYLGLPSAKK
ncbi:uncharacterized protein KY384_000517 [Bacidia gigantensis]|uniref:uncharacterized protein n=1 Tax=Bacidia gigantensis TaxID=2732470 RepID=UPI001D03A8AE|nr:uncharacterized protein KY384_000517 [Bacidia gigantensis]KAG8525757.1 hypothetical protein KY384_000517 [Bacidia gigantensis]